IFGDGDVTTGAPRLIPDSSGLIANALSLIAHLLLQVTLMLGHVALVMRHVALMLRFIAHALGFLLRCHHCVMNDPAIHVVVLLNTGRGGWTVRDHVVNDQTETFRQAELFADHARNIRRLDAKISDRNLFLVTVAISAWTDGSIRWRARRRIWWRRRIRLSE